MPTPPSRSGISTPSLDEADGFLLLTIEHAVVKQIYDEETMTLARGEFKLECVSLPIPSEIGQQTANPFSPSPADPPIPTHDFWLIIKVGPTFEMPIIPNSEMLPKYIHGEGIIYTIPSPHISNASILFNLPLPNSQADLEDLDSFEVLLRQYGCLSINQTALSNITLPLQNTQRQQRTSAVPSSSSTGGSQHVDNKGRGEEEMLAPEELRGRIVLINEDNGQVVGELEQQFDIEEDKKLLNEDKSKPVMLDFTGQLREGQQALQVKVRTIPEEDLQDDWILRGANTLSKGLSTFSQWSSKQMISGADTFIRNSTPSAEPVKFSPQTKQNFVKVHNGSVKAATVTKSTIGKITGVISTAAEKTYNHGYKPARDAYRRNSTTGAYSAPSSAYPSSSATGVAPIPVPYQVRQSATSPPPPIPNKPSHLQGTSPIPPPLPTSEKPNPTIAIPPSYGATNYTSEPNNISGPNTPGSVNSSANATPTTKKKKALLGRVLLAGEVVLTSLEATAHDLINNGTIAASSAAGHKYGPDAGEATALVGGSVKNVAVVYIDVAGVGRRAILKSTAKGFVKAKLADGETVKLQAEGHGQQIMPGQVEIQHNNNDNNDRTKEDEIVIGMPELNINDHQHQHSSRNYNDGNHDQSGLRRR
ncbi:uncharacterized protein L201_004174 [Kwoniella dendrophila CBS 6074]|uniref:Senescence domain-containing protein n=1 Tax=Kwoniella dendrophila CBS 6074 TaxID=1295534 RepID=A0AAX4JWG6_9TREE